jgi:hypothetical protein
VAQPVGVAFRPYRGCVPCSRGSIPLYRGSIPLCSLEATAGVVCRGEERLLPFFYLIFTTVGLWVNFVPPIQGSASLLDGSNTYMELRHDLVDGKS